MNFTHVDLKIHLRYFWGQINAKMILLNKGYENNSMFFKNSLKILFDFIT